MSVTRIPDFSINDEEGGVGMAFFDVFDNPQHRAEEPVVKSVSRPELEVEDPAIRRVLESVLE